MGTEFVGRAPELDRLLALPSAARRAPGAVAAILTGAPGSGKTRLMAEASAGLTRLRTARLIGYEPVEAVPLAAASDLLRELGVPWDRDPVRIFEAAHGARIRSGPTVMFIDDLQWVDRLSLGLVHYLIRAAEAGRQPLTIVAAARPSAAVETFREGLAALLPEDRRWAIELGPLNIHAGVSLVRSLDSTLDADRATAIWRRAHGSPFWLEALTLGEGRPEASSLVADRLAMVSGDGATVLGAMGIGGRPLGEAELAAVLGWPADRVAGAVHELVVRGLGMTTAAGVRFSHDLIREAAVAELPRPAARRLHERYAKWIEGEPDADLGQLREALEHRRAAGLPAAALATRVINAPGSRLLGLEGLHLIADIADNLPPRSAERLHLDVGIAELAESLGNHKLALERWSHIAERSPDAGVRRNAELQSSTAAYRLGQTEDARAALARARAIEGEPPAEVSIRIDALEASIELWLEHRTAAGIVAAQRALDAARGLAVLAGGMSALSRGEIRAYDVALQAASDAAMQGNRWDDMLALAHEIERLSDLMDDEAAAVDAITRLGTALHQIGRAGDAEPLLRRAWTLAQERILPMSAVDAGNALALVLSKRGLLRESRAVAAETGALETRLGDRWLRANWLVHVLDLSLGDPKTALDALSADVDRQTDRHIELGMRQEIAEWQARFGGATSAEIDGHLAQARAAAAEVTCPRCGAELAIIDAEIQARLDRVEDAEAKLSVWLDSETEALAAGTLWRHRTETAIALARGDHAAARAAAEATIADAVRLEQALPELWARIDLGRALAAVDRAAAVGAYTMASEQAERIGALTEGRLIARALRKLGVRAWRRTSSSGGRTSMDAVAPVALGGLSTREREIAVLIGRGQTNAEIAEALVISPKTVERHVTNVYAKLGLRNRAELAGVVQGASLVRGSPDDWGSSAS